MRTVVLGSLVTVAYNAILIAAISYLTIHVTIWALAGLIFVSLKPFYLSIEQEREIETKEQEIREFNFDA